MENNVNDVKVETTTETKKGNVYTAVHGIFALLALVLGALYYNWIYVVNNSFGRWEIGIFAFAVAFALYVAAFVVVRKKKVGVETWFFMAVFLAIAVRFLLHQDGEAVMITAFCGIHALALLMVASMKESVADDIVPRGLKACFVAPFVSFHALPVAVGRGFFKKKESDGQSDKRIEHFGLVLAGICVALPVVMIVLLLLVRDSFFSRFMLDAMEFITEIKLGEYINILTILVAMFLFGAVYSADKEKQVRPSVDVAILPSIFVNTIIVTLLAVYAVFVVAQIDGYASMIMGKIPEGVTYADFARGGFFALCVVACINGAVIYAANVLAEKNAKKVKGFSIALAAVTYLLLVTAAVKMGMYISAYGFTEKRLFTVWFMLLLAVLFALTLIKLKNPGFKLSRYSVYVTGVMFVVLCDVNYVWLSDKINDALGFVK